MAPWSGPNDSGDPHGTRPHEHPGCGKAIGRRMTFEGNRRRLPSRSSDGGNEHKTTAYGRKTLTNHVRLWVDGLGMSIGALRNQGSREGGAKPVLTGEQLVVPRAVAALEREKSIGELVSS